MREQRPRPVPPPSRRPPVGCPGAAPPRERSCLGRAAVRAVFNTVGYAVRYELVAGMPRGGH
eukprot:6760356-Prymnesium_polylepis.1